MDYSQVISIDDEDIEVRQNCSKIKCSIGEKNFISGDYAAAVKEFTKVIAHFNTYIQTHLPRSPNTHILFL